MKTLKIHGAEDFGVAFDCAVRMYMRDFADETLDTIFKAVKRYLPYYSYRTVVCAIRDLQDFTYGFKTKLQPDYQKETYEYILRALTRRGLTLFPKDTQTHYRNEEEQWIDFAREAELLDSPLDRSKFNADAVYLAWVKEYQLFLPAEVRNVTEDILFIGKEDFELFYQLTETMILYSLGRLSYMPFLSQNFVKNNLPVFNDMELVRILDSVEVYLKEYAASEYQSGMKNEICKDWQRFKEDLESEQVKRFWYAKAKDQPKKIPGLLEGLLEHKEEKNYHDWLRIYHAYQGIERYIKGLPKAKRDTYKKTMDRTNRTIGKYAHKTWLKEEGYKYDKAGKDSYVLKKEYKS